MDRRPSDEYLDDWTMLANRFRAGEFDEALVTIWEMVERHPDRFAAIAHAQVCVLLRLGRVDDAIGVMSRVVDRDRWWSPRQLSDPDLMPLVGHSEYESLATVMRRGAERAFAEALSTAAPIEVLRPVGCPRWSVVALHMASVSGHETAEIWQPVTESGVAVVVVESSLHNGDGQPYWDDSDLAERDVRLGVARACEIGGRLVLAGGSQGAGVAARLALGGVAPGLVGYLCVVGAPASGSWTASASVPGLLVVGGADSLTANVQRQFGRQARDHGLPVEVIEIPGLQHRYPDDWGALAPRLLDRWLT